MICKIKGLHAPERGPRIPLLSGQCLSYVFAPDRELLGGFDTHLDAAARSAEQSNLNGAVGEQLSHGHVRVHAVRRLDDYGFVSAAAEN
jgi:hypothetical protein